MSRRIVLDASAGIGLVLGVRGAKRFASMIEEAAVVVAPGLYSAECANALWKYVAAGDLTADDAAHQLQLAMNLVDIVEPDSHLAQEALGAACAVGHPVYDMLLSYIKFLKHHL